MTGQPDNYGGEQPCVAENSVHFWNDFNCNEEFVFVCQGGKNKLQFTYSLFCSF